MCEESTKDGFGFIYSLSLRCTSHTGSTCVLLWLHADAYVSPSPSCTMQCGQKAKVWGSALADCNPDCFSLNSLVSLGRQACQHMQSEAKEQRYLLGMYHLPLSTSSQNTQTSALKCCVQQTGVKHQLCLKLLIHTKFFRAGALFLLSVCTVFTTMASVSWLGLLHS